MNTPAATILPREAPIAKRRSPPVPRAVKERARVSLAYWVGRAREEFKRPVAMPTISFDLVGTTAAWAMHDIRHVQLNGVLLTENIESFESDTIPHELAHLLATEFTGKRCGHGPVWQETMRRLGVNPERTHSYDVTNSRTTPVVHGYSCRCGPHPLTERKHAKARTGRTWYTCKKCKQRIRWTGASAPSGPGATLRPSVSTSPAGRPNSFSPPSKATPAARPPSEAMLRFATSLAKKHGIAVPANAVENFELCRQFLDKWAKQPVTEAPVNRPPCSAMPPRTAEAPAPAFTADGPTEKQLAYAKSIAARKKLDIPAAALNSKREISLWIDQHR